MMTTPNNRTWYDGIEGEEKRLARILLVIILIFLGGSGGLIFLDVVWGDRTLWALLAAGCLSQLIPLYLLSKGKLEASSFVTVGIYIFFATISATIGQGIRDYVLIVYPSIILFSGLTQKGRGMMIATVLTLMAFAWLTFGDIYGLYTPQTPNPAILFDFIILGILIVVSSLGVHLLVENLEYNHRMTKTELLERKKAEALLHESEESFKEIFENSPDNIFVFEVCADNKFRAKKINSALEKIFNTERANIEGKYLDEIVDAKSAEVISNNFRQCIETRAQVQYDEFANLPNKSYSTSLIPIMEKNGAVTRLIGISRDITQLKQTEAHLRDSETRFRLLFETMIQGVILYSANGEIISANPAAELLLGLTVEQMQGRTPVDPRWKSIHEDGSEFPGNEHPAIVALHTGQAVQNVIMGVFNPQSQEYRWINIHAVPQFKDGEQKPHQVYTTFDDMTERKKIAETLKASETRYRLLAENISDVIWIYDIIENRTRYISPSVERLRGYTPEEIISGNMATSLTPESFQYVQKSIAARLKDFQNGKREFYADELEQTCKNGSTVWTEVTANFQINPENGHIEIYGVSRDISEKRQAREALLASEERIRQLVDSAPYSIFGINQDGTINFANIEASSLIGYSNAELIGKKVDELLPTRFRESHSVHRHEYGENPYIRRLGTGINLLAQHKDGREIPVDIKLSYYRFEGSLHIIVFMQDISERKKAEKLLQESEARFRLLFETMVQGVVFQSTSGEIVMANPAAEHLLGLTREQLQGRTSMDPRWRTIHEDGSDLPGQEHPAMIALRTGQEVRNVVLGVFNPQINDYRWININAVPQFKDGEREPYQVYTTFDDVTERKKINEALKASETRYRLLAENISDVIWILDVNMMRFRYVSPSIEKLRGYTADEVLLQSISEVLTPASLKLFQEKFPTYVQEYLDGKNGVHVNEVEQPCKDGSTIWTESTTSFRINEDTSHLEVYGVSRDITERKLNEHLLMQANQDLQNHVKKIEQLRMELQEQAIHDPLTGLYNRRYLAEYLTHEIIRAERENIPISLLMLDVDHFKNINDSFGHKTGDKFLIAIAELLKKNSRGSDIACRYGGEEFILVLPGTETQAAFDRAEQFRIQCAQIHVPHIAKGTHVTISIGIATYPYHSKMAEDIIIKADKALYRSKQTGRNKVMIWEETQEDVSG